MNWQSIKVSADNTHFLFKGNQLFEKNFIEVLKFHSPGIASVLDNTGAYHINSKGEPIYPARYTRTFGFYCNRAAVSMNEKWFHINELGKQAYQNFFLWVGNFQENLCPVRDYNNKYFHINLDGHKVYSETFIYAGDFKDGLACVKTSGGFYRHIDTSGKYINKIDFLDLGIFHKNYATAKDKNGWHHINKQGRELYTQRYASIEPFYNGFALVTQFDNQKIIIDENGKKVISV